MSFSGDLDVEEFVKKFVRGDFDINHEDPNTKTLRDALTKYQIGKSEARISKIIAVGRNVILGMDYNEIFKYKVDKNAPLPTGEPVEKLGQPDLPFEIRSEGSNNDEKEQNRKRI